MESSVNYNFTDQDLDILSSNRALKMMMLQGENINPVRTLRYMKYERYLGRLQVELIKMQKWINDNDQRLCILFEGRDVAGKGGAIRRIIHHLNPRLYNVVALRKPTNQEKGQWYFQRYINKLPNPGRIVFFDRSWYNRAGVEPVNGFCTQQEYERFMNEVNHFEKMITNGKMMLIKFYFSISKEEQAQRFEDIKGEPLKRWKMSLVDESAQELWDVYTEYKDRMLKHTNTKQNPWTVLKANRKTSARIKAIEHILKTVPYEGKLPVEKEE